MSQPDEKTHAIADFLRSIGWQNHGDAMSAQLHGSKDKLRELLGWPEGCTPADVRNLREANHAMAQRIHELELLPPNEVGAEDLRVLRLKAEEFDVWIDKTAWVQQAANRGELPISILGLHLADGMRQVIERLQALVGKPGPDVDPWRIDQGRHGIHIRRGKPTDPLGGGLVAVVFNKADADRIVQSAPTQTPVASNVKACALNAIERGIELLDAVAHGKTTTKLVIKSAVRKLEFAALALKCEAKLNTAATCSYKCEAWPECGCAATAPVEPGEPADMRSLAQGFEVTGPDADGLLWLVLHGIGTTGKAMFNLGAASRVAGQVALLWERDRRAALATPAPVAQGDTITVQEAWEAAGGNPGIKATKSELLDALSMLDKVCDEAPAPVARPAAWCDLADGETIRRGDRLLSAGKQWVGVDEHLIGQQYKAKSWHPVQRPAAPAPVARPEMVCEGEDRRRVLERVKDVMGSAPSPVALTPAQLETIIRRETSDPEWHDKAIHPFMGASFQNWKVSLYLPVPLSETDKSFEAALKRWAADMLKGDA
jgi:hypothetical protein